MKNDADSSSETSSYQSEGEGVLENDKLKDLGFDEMMQEDDDSEEENSTYERFKTKNEIANPEEAGPKV